MSEESMDKKKKNEDEKEIIDFMELVEENLSSMGVEKNEISKNDLCEDPIKNELFENKPLQGSEENKPIKSSEENKPIKSSEENKPIKSSEENEQLQDTEENILNKEDENKSLQDTEENILNKEDENKSLQDAEENKPIKSSEENKQLQDAEENKPLQDTEENKSLQDAEENKQLQDAEKEDNLEFLGSDEDFMVGRSSSEVGDIITEDILEDLKKDLIKEDSYEDDSFKDNLQEDLRILNNDHHQKDLDTIKNDNIHEDLKTLNKHIKQMAIDSVSEKKVSSNIILRQDDTLEIRAPLQKEDIRIHKYPGFLYINIYAIEKYISSDMNVQSVFIRMETDNFVYETDDYSEDSNIRLNSLVHLSLSSNKSFKLRFIMNKRAHSGIIKSCECVVNIDREFLDKIHNTLYEVNHEWTAYSSSNIIKNFLSFFTYSVADAYRLKLYFSFISEEEFKVIGVPIPNSLYDLGRWLKIRKHAYNTWFSGFCNIRGNITNICTHLWKRRFIKIYGYKIYIFNEHTKNLMGIFNLISTMTKGRQIFEEDNKIKIVNDGDHIEFHFENNEKYNLFRNVLEALI